MPRFIHSCFARSYCSSSIVEGRLGRQLSLVQLRLVRHVLVWIAALLEVGVVVAAKMSDGVRKLMDAQLSQRFHEVVERGGEKLTRVHEYDVADLQQHVTLSVRRNDAHVGIRLFPRPRRILGVILAKELQHGVSVVRRQIVKHDRHEVCTLVVAVTVAIVAVTVTVVVVIVVVVVATDDIRRITLRRRNFTLAWL